MTSQTVPYTVPPAWHQSAWNGTACKQANSRVKVKFAKAQVDKTTNQPDLKAERQRLVPADLYAMRIDVICLYNKCTARRNPGVEGNYE
jgi:hypothetical protein